MRVAKLKTINFLKRFRYINMPSYREVTILFGMCQVIDVDFGDIISDVTYEAMNGVRGLLRVASHNWQTSVSQLLHCNHNTVLRNPLCSTHSQFTIYTFYSIYICCEFIMGFLGDVNKFTTVDVSTMSVDNSTVIPPTKRMGSSCYNVQFAL